MRFAVDAFRGEAPRLDAHLLPENAAQSAVNCRLVDGNLSAFKQFVSTKVLANAGPVPTIFLLNGSWLSFDSQTDIAPGLIPGDNTFLTFLTNPSVYTTPRYTTYSLATTGAEPYPVTTKPLGVPEPTVAPTFSPPTVAGTPPIDVLDEGDDIAQWTGSINYAYASVTQTAVVGNPIDSYESRYSNNAGSPAYRHRNFGIAGASSARWVADLRFESVGGGTAYQQFVLGLMAPLDATDCIKIIYSAGIGTTYFRIGIGTGWNTTSFSQLADAGVFAALSETTWYSVDVTISSSAGGTKTIVAKLMSGVTVLAEATYTGAFTIGDYCGFVNETSESSASFGTYWDNIHVTATLPDPLIINVATSYVYTFVNTVSGTSIRWESAPSPASDTLLRPDGVSVTVTTETTHAYDVNYGIDAKRIYRAVTGATGTVYRFVAEIPLLTATYDDELDDSELGEVLESEDWDLPPDDLQGIITLPNGIVAGFRRNQLCLSAQGRPHAWPVAYRLSTDTDIVGIGNIDNTIVVGTKKYPYLAGGNDPANYSMSRLDDYPQSCTSKRSFATLGRFGVVYACPDGLMAISGTGQGQLLTGSLFTRDQWQALGPTTIIGVTHDDTYFFSFTGTAPDASYALDAKADGFGLVSLSFHFIAAHADPLTDNLYLVVDVNSEPTDGSLPLASNAITPSNKTIFQFHAHATNFMVAKWKGRLNMPQYPVAPLVGQVQSVSYNNTVAKFYGDGALLMTKVVSSNQEFRVTANDMYSTYEMELLTTNSVRKLRAAEDVEELG